MLFGRDCHNIDRHVLSALLAVVEADAAVGEREKRVGLAEAHVGARIDAGPALAHDDVAADHFLAAELLHAEATAGRITTVARATACFLVCHCELLRTYFFGAGLAAAGFLAAGLSSALA